MYGRFTIPLCTKCNSALGTALEDPISKAFNEGYDGVVRYLREGGYKPLFLWISLIFLKSYLKDREHRWHLDRRKGDESIADQFDWVEMHHIHCMVRSLYTGAVLEDQALGSMFVLPAKRDETDEFDYADILGPKCALLRSQDTAVIAIFDDACAVANILMPSLAGLGYASPLGAFQLRELLARMAFVNMRLKQRPVFHSREADDGVGWIVTGTTARVNDFETVGQGVY